MSYLINLSKKFGDFFWNNFFLIVVNLFHRRKNFHWMITVIREFNESFDVFWKTRTAITATWIQKTIPYATIRTNPNTNFLYISTKPSDKFANSFINEIRVASMALEAYLVNSADLTSIIINLFLLRWKGEYKVFITDADSSDSTPIIILSGF